MKRVFLSALIAALSLSLISVDAQARRLGGGASSGMKRTLPQQPAGRPGPTAPAAAPTAAPAQQQAAAPAAPAPLPAAAPKRSWMGPLAGLAAGLGIAALASHFGLGGELANVMTALLLGVGVMLLIGFVMRRFAGAKPQGLQYAGAGTPYAAPQPAAVPAAPPVAAASGAAVEGSDGFDAAAFEQIAKRVFIRLQAANDAGDQTDLRRFTTPEMYGVVQQELLDRRGAAQRTEVLQLDARVIDRAEEQGQQIVSVRFWGLVREQSEAAAENFDEVWHLVRPLDGSHEWAIAGIQASA